ncbi:DMT family transporter [Oleidesulfovibrio sp.]|uniref:DMT family transporter n=1 Tax=Oleidesulfovibrio sp. TaxID=2909707 RepID=UPI003A8666C9
MSVRFSAYVYLAAGMSIAGSAVVAGKLMVASIPVFLAVEMGLLVSLFVLLPVVWCNKNYRTALDGKAHLQLLMQALCGVVLYRIFMFWGLQFTTATAGGLINSAVPALVALLAFVLLRERLAATRLIGVGCVSAGILAVNLIPFLTDSSQANSALKGNCLVLAAVFSEAAFAVLSKAHERPMSALFRTAMVSLYAFLCLLPLAIYDARNFNFGSIDAQTAWCIVYYGVVVSFLSYVFWFKGIVHVPASVAASFAGFVPLSSVFFSYVVLNEQVSGAHWAGLACVLAGIWASCLPEKANVKADDAEPELPETVSF